MTATADDLRPSSDELELRNRETAARRRGYLIGGLVATLVVGLLSPLAWMWVDNNIYLRDDRSVGERFRTQMHLDGFGCEHIAEVLYDHGIRSGGYTNNDDGSAPRSEQAFYAGCTGSDDLHGDD